jgi:hypothetical protein
LISDLAETFYAESLPAGRRYGVTSAIFRFCRHFCRQAPVVVTLALRTVATMEQRPRQHWLRHSHATHALERGVPIHPVARRSGTGRWPRGASIFTPARRTARRSTWRSRKQGSAPSTLGSGPRDPPARASPRSSTWHENPPL